MKRLALAAPVLLGLCGTVQAELREDTRQFELTPAPLPPALKYQLLYESLPERSQGNAALLYMQAVLIMGNEPIEKADKALEAFEAKDMKTFTSLANAIDPPGLFPVLELAARRSECDWQPPLREMGAETRLPYLNALREVNKVIRIRALQQIDQGKPADAVATLRQGYELAEKVGHDPVMVSSLVSMHLIMTLDDVISQLMSRPDSPNLYWAFINFPNSRQLFRTGLSGERQFHLTTIPGLAKAEAGQDLSVEEWRALFAFLDKLMDGIQSSPKKVDVLKDSSPAALKEAQQYYADQHHLPLEQVAKLDPLVVLGTFYYHQYQITADEIFKLPGLSYPQLLAKIGESDERSIRLSHEYPGNPFLAFPPVLGKYTTTFVHVDRQLAALTAVEAIRSYAASHDGKVPERLADLVDTPAPDNPATGKPFEYHVENNVATLSDPRPDGPLTYTIRIRK